MFQRLLAIVCCLAAVLLTTSAAPAQFETQLNASMRTGPVYPVGRWIPLRIDLGNRTDAAIDGFVELPIQEGQTSYMLERAVRVPANARVSVELMATFHPPENPGKAGETPTVGTVKWVDATRHELKREPLLGLADSGGIGSKREATGYSGVLLWQISDQYSDDEIYEPIGIADLLSKALPFSINIANAESAGAPRRMIAYDAARLVVLDSGAVDHLDPSQREALLQHIHDGATLLVSRPTADLASTWLGPYLPADIIGERQITSLVTKEFGTLNIRKPATLCDAVLRPGAVSVATNERGAIASYREFGFGRVALVGVPFNLFPDSETKAPDFWKAAIGPERPAFNDPAALAISELPASTDAKGVDDSVVSLLPHMIGAKAPPWRTAASIAGLYTGLVALVLIISGAKRRPMAFVACVVAGVLLAGGVLLLGQLRGADQKLMMARIGTVDVDGGVGRQEEVLTFFGEKRNDISLNLGNQAVAKPLVAIGDKPPTVSMFPLTVRDINSSDGKLTAVWRVRSTLDNAPQMSASIEFGPDGAKLNVDSGLKSTLEAPRLVWDTNVFPLGNISPGKQTINVGPRNPVGSWDERGGMIADDLSKLRTQLLKRSTGRSANAILSTVQNAPPRLTGFVPDGIGPDTMVDESMQKREQTLLRTALTILPAAKGTEVRIDPGFVRMTDALQPGLPVEPSTGVYREVSQTTVAVVGFGPPEGLGKLDPKRVEVNLDLRGSGFDINLRRGQCKGGKVVPNSRGDVVLNWHNRTGADRATIEVQPDDVDANGWVWLMFTVDPVAPEAGLLSGVVGGGDINNRQWQIVRWDTTLSGVITGPAQPVIQTWPAGMPKDDDDKPKPPPKKPADKKPADAKPAAKKPDPKKADAAKKPDAKPKTEPKKQ